MKCILFVDTQRNLNFFLFLIATSNYLHVQTIRFSFMGSCDGPYSFVIMYDVVQRVLNRTSISGHETIKLSEGETLFHYMQSELNKQKCSNTGLPFDFNGGFIGYFGYEMKLECGAYADEYSKVKNTNSNILLPSHKLLRVICFFTLQDQGVPDAAFFFVDRFIAVDHKESCIYLVSLVDKPNVKSSELAMEWLNTTSNQLKQMETNNNCVNIPLHSKIHEPLKFILERSYECYKGTGPFIKYLNLIEIRIFEILFS